MVSSSKKKRGKQRKAAKAQAVATNRVPTVDENTESAGGDAISRDDPATTCISIEHHDKVHVSVVFDI